MHSQFLFIVGLHRSGTSPLARLLASHPDISGLSGTGVPKDEGQHLYDVLPPAKRFGGPGRYAWSPECRAFEPNARHLQAIRERVWDAWAPYWDTSRPILLEKSPVHLLRTRWLQALFPNSVFVVIIRHPIVVALATRKWARTSNKSLVGHWVAAHDQFSADAPHLTRVHVVHYEDLVSRPAQTLAVPMHQIGVDPDELDLSLLSGQNARYYDEWEKSTNSWWGRRRSTSIGRTFAEHLLDYGYLLSEPYTTTPCRFEATGLCVNGASR